LSPSLRLLRKYRPCMRSPPAMWICDEEACMSE
jgi:hypothetical protein